VVERVALRLADPPLQLDAAGRVRRQRGAAAAAIIGRLPAQLLLAFSLEELQHHVGVALDFEGRPGQVARVEARPARHDMVEVTVCCWDSPGRLAAITGVMLAHRVEILGAQVHTLERAEHAAGTVLDVFTTRPPSHGDEGLWQELSRDLERALKGELEVAALVERHTRPSALAPKVVPRVELVVKVDNTISDRLTVIDVQAPDRLGVLYAITRTLSEQGLAIHLSKVATEAGRVIDIFYVSDPATGGKLTDEARLAEVRRSVLSAIEALDERARAGSAPAPGAATASPTAKEG